MELKKFYKENKQLLIAFFILAILAFGFFGTNLILNVDGINDLPMNDMAQGYQTHLAMGRWGWALIATIFGYMPIPFFLIILNALLLSISGIFINKVFGINNKIYQFIIGAILICFPYAANVFSYVQWHFIYGLGVFLTVYGIYRLKEGTSLKDYLLVILLFIFSISLYQAFLPIIVTFLIALVMMEIINKIGFKELMKKIGKYLLILMISCLLYIFITELVISIFNIEPLKYQKADKMFDLTGNLLENLYAIILNVFLFFQDQLTFPITIKIGLYLILLLGGLLNIFEIKKRDIPLFILLFLILLVAPHILELPNPNRWFHDITLLGYLALFTTGVALLIKFIETYTNTIIIKKLVIIIFIPLIFLLVITINRASVLSRMASNAALSYVNRLQMRVESLDGYSSLPDPKKYYVVSYLGIDYFPFNRDLYPYGIGVTTSFISGEKDIVDAVRVLGINATTASDKIGNKTRNEILDLVYSSTNGSDKIQCYPDKESVFIYQDIIVISMCRYVKN